MTCRRGQPLPAPPSMPDPIELDAEHLSRAIAAREISCVEVMAAFLDRIERLNPDINAIVSLRPRAELLAEAAMADATDRRGPLHGFPFAIKDLVETAGLLTTHGSPLFANHIPATDDLLAARIRAAGAILIGKTNTPEFGLGSHSFNPVHGVTRNPYDLSKTAGGSSGGAAAALAARLVPLADGSDTMGSLRNPAAFCNVYGLRPSFGRIPRDPVGDLFLNQISTDGPMARTVRDIALLLDVMAGPAPHDPHALPEHASFLAGLDTPTAATRIGWLGDWGGHFAVEPEVLGLCEAALATFGDLGIVVDRIPPPFDAGRLWSAWLTLRSAANAAGNRRLYDDPASRALLKPEMLYEIESGLAVSALDFYAASAVRTEWFAAAASLFGQYDALVLPSAQLFPFDAGLRWPKTVAGRAMTTYHQWMEIVVPASIAGLPALNVPVGFSKAGLPMGMQLMGRRGGDLGILQLGEAYHRATDWPGRFAPVLKQASMKG
jgi:amidase